MTQVAVTAANTAAQPLDDDGFILLMDLDAIVPLHPQHIRKLARRGEFPAPIKIGGRTAFRRSEIREWCRDPNGYRRQPAER